VVQTFFLERSLFPMLADALAPEGLLLMETFTRAQAGEPWGPSNPAYLLKPGELEAAFPTLETLEYREASIEDETGRRRHVAGIVARRPGA
jgi:tellurite methyltransferase